MEVGYKLTESGMDLQDCADYAPGELSTEDQDLLHYAIGMGFPDVCGTMTPATLKKMAETTLKNMNKPGGTWAEDIKAAYAHLRDDPEGVCEKLLLHGFVKLE